MSYRHNYNFISPEPIFAIIKEELKAYYDTGSIDDIMFNTYLNKCLNKLGLATYTIVWDLGDVGIGLMTIFNIIMLYPLSRKALTALKNYEKAH